MLGENDVALVTGGAAGLGNQIVQRLVQKGVEVYVLDVVEPPASLGAKVTFLRCDLADENHTRATISGLVQSLAAHNKHISVLVNNAGVRHSGPLLELAPDAVRRVFNVNTLSHVWTLQEVANHHIHQVLPSAPGAQLYMVSISSILGVLAPRNLSMYSASKAATISMYEALAQELTPHASIRILQVWPGQLTTDMFKDVVPSRQFLAPLVSHVQLAGQIVARIDTGESGVLCEPAYANFLPVVRVLPMSVQKACRWFSQMDEKVH